MAIVPPLISDDEYGIPSLMLSFGVMTIIGAIITGVYMKETKGKTKEQIIDMFVLGTAGGISKEPLAGGRNSEYI
jgi:hypothetical protein